MLNVLRPNLVDVKKFILNLNLLPWPGVENLPGTGNSVTSLSWASVTYHLCISVDPHRACLSEHCQKKLIFVFCQCVLYDNPSDYSCANFIKNIFLKQAPYLDIFSRSVQFWPNFHYLYFIPAERRTVGRCVSRHSVEISISDGQEDRVLRVIRKWSEESCGWQ